MELITHEQFVSSISRHFSKSFVRIASNKVSLEHHPSITQAGGFKTVIQSAIIESFGARPVMQLLLSQCPVRLGLACLVLPSRPLPIRQNVYSMTADTPHPPDLAKPTTNLPVNLIFPANTYHDFKFPKFHYVPHVPNLIPAVGKPCLIDATVGENYNKLKRTRSPE